MGAKLDIEHWKNKLYWVASNPIVWIVAGVSLLVVVIGILLSSHEEVVRVSAAKWKFVYTIERYKIRPDDGFDPPGDAFEVRSQGPRIHHYDRVFSHYDYYTDTESYSCGQQCSGTGSGRSCYSKTCYRSVRRRRSVYRDDPVYRTYYAWRAWRWGRDRTAVFSDQNNPARDIAPSEFRFKEGLGPGEDERYKRKDDFEVTFTSGDDSWDYEPDHLADFRRYAIGQALTIRVNGFGSILDAGFGVNE